MNVNNMNLIVESIIKLASLCVAFPKAIVLILSITLHIVFNVTPKSPALFENIFGNSRIISYVSIYAAL